jgi:hypothetical protein
MLLAPNKALAQTTASALDKKIVTRLLTLPAKSALSVRSMQERFWFIATVIDVTGGAALMLAGEFVMLAIKYLEMSIEQWKWKWT